MFTNWLFCKENILVSISVFILYIAPIFDILFACAECSLHNFTLEISFLRALTTHPNKNAQVAETFRQPATAGTSP